MCRLVNSNCFVSKSKTLTSLLEKSDPPGGPGGPGGPCKPRSPSIPESPANRPTEISIFRTNKLAVSSAKRFRQYTHVSRIIIITVVINVATGFVFDNYL